MRAPHGQTVNAAFHWFAEKISADQGWQIRHFLGHFLQEENVGMMSFDESGYILYPRASQTQQVPAYNFQISIHRWRSSVPKYPSLLNHSKSGGVPRRPAGTQGIVALNVYLRNI